MRKPVVALGLVALALAAAVSVQRMGGDGPSVIRVQSDGLRTFSVVHQRGGTSVACPMFGLVDPLTGVLRGDRAARPEMLWMDIGDRHASIVWPAGFSLRFEPGAALYDEVGTKVGVDGATITLDQVRATDHAGTFADPYLADGLVFGRCYPYLP